MMLKGNARMIIGFDLDGVIIDHAPNKLALAEGYAVRLRPEETHSERLAEKFARNEYLAFQDELYGNSVFALSAPLMEGALEVLHALKSGGVPLVLISLRRIPENAIAILSARGLWGEIFNKQNVFFVRTPEEKNIVGMRLGVTHFFDDERKVLRVMPDIRKRFLVDTYQQFDDEAGISRVYNWEMVRSAILPQGA